MNAIGPKKGSHGALVQTGVQNQSRIISGQDDDDIFALVLHLFDQSIHSFLAKAVLPETSGHLCNVHVQLAHVQVPWDREDSESTVTKDTKGGKTNQNFCLPLVFPHKLFHMCTAVYPNGFYGIKTVRSCEVARYQSFCGLAVCSPQLEVW